jgi:hypothetical protein
MSRRRALKGVAYGLVETFVSRNNDVSGYWGIGQLYREALERQVRSVTLDLLGPCSPFMGLVAQAVQAHYAERLEHMALNAGASLSQARVVVEFGTFGSTPPHHVSSYGDPLLCTVSLAGPNGRTYNAVHTGRCAPHDPAAESRSNRAAAP